MSTESKTDPGYTYGVSISPITNNRKMKKTIQEIYCLLKSLRIAYCDIKMVSVSKWNPIAKIWVTSRELEQYLLDSLQNVHNIRFNIRRITYSPPEWRVVRISDCAKQVEAPNKVKLQQRGKDRGQIQNTTSQTSVGSSVSQSSVVKPKTSASGASGTSANQPSKQRTLNRQESQTSVGSSISQSSIVKQKTSAEIPWNPAIKRQQPDEERLPDSKAVSQTSIASPASEFEFAKPKKPAPRSHGQIQRHRKTAQNYRTGLKYLATKPASETSLESFASQSSFGNPSPNTDALGKKTQQPATNMRPLENMTSSETSIASSGSEFVFVKPTKPAKNEIDRRMAKNYSPVQKRSENETDSATSLESSASHSSAYKLKSSYPRTGTAGTQKQQPPKVQPSDSKTSVDSYASSQGSVQQLNHLQPGRNKAANGQQAGQSTAAKVHSASSSSAPTTGGKYYNRGRSPGKSNGNKDGTKRKRSVFPSPDERPPLKEHQRDADTSTPVAPPCNCPHTRFYHYLQYIGRETRHAEFKASGSIKNQYGFRSQVAKYMCAFLNADGGVIYFGVNDDGQVKGVDIVNYTEQDVLDDVHYVATRMLRPPVDPQEYSVNFARVHNSRNEPIRDVFVLEICVKPRSTFERKQYTTDGVMYVRREASVHAGTRSKS